jgi:hypothetical protein
VTDDETVDLVSEAVDLGNGCLLALAVDPDGSWRPWIMRPGNHCDCGCWRPCCAPHEQPGRLPALYRERLAMRCGRPTAKGTPCRVWVASPGQACPQHDDAPPSRGADGG